MQLVQLPYMLFVKTDKYCLKMCTNVMSVTVECTCNEFELFNSFVGTHMTHGQSATFNFPPY